MLADKSLFCLRKGNIYAVPVIHYNMEMAAQVRLAYQRLQPDCVAVELAATMESELLQAAARLPELTVAISYDKNNDPIYYLCEPCDPAFEGLRSAIEDDVAAHCIDLDVDFYPDTRDQLPDPYAISRIGLRQYYEAYADITLKKGPPPTELDKRRELHMAKRLKELSLSHDTILFIGGMYHVQRVLDLIDSKQFPTLEPAEREVVQLCSLTEASQREVMAECAWFTEHYESLREAFREQDPELYFGDETGSGSFPPDRQKLLYKLYKEGGERYRETTGNSFHGYHLRNVMKFVRNYCLIKQRLMPDLFQLLTAAKGSVDHNYAYEVWELATTYSHHKNVDNLEELDLSIEDIWGNSKLIHFHLKDRSGKSQSFRRRKEKKGQYRFDMPNLFGICSYQPEDIVIENFAEYLKQKGRQILCEEAGRTVPFTTSLEDGVDTRETLRNWHEGKIYVQIRGRPPGGVGSIVLIFDEDSPEESQAFVEKYPWRTTWLGEHTQESDMSFYATPLGEDIIGPGISRCEYGGLMMSYPPRRMYDVWSDPDYSHCRSKAEALLMAGIDYAVEPIIMYVAATPPRSQMKSYARRYDKKLVYMPIGQISPVMLNRIRVFHVLDGHDKRPVAGDYIF